MKNKGFTLVELLIVILIIATLAGIAVPSYQSHVRTANRIDIQLEMAELSLIAERQFARQNTYPTFPIKITHSYELIFLSDITTFEIIATPQGMQAADECGQMKLNQTGETSDELPSKSCW